MASFLQRLAERIYRQPTKEDLASRARDIEDANMRVLTDMSYPLETRQTALNHVPNSAVRHQVIFAPEREMRVSAAYCMKTSIENKRFLDSVARTHTDQFTARAAADRSARMGRALGLDKPFRTPRLE